MIEENWQESKRFWRETVQNEIDILSSRPVVHIDSVVENPIFEFGIESYQTTRTAPCLEPVFLKSLVIWLQLNRWQRLKYGKMKMLTREPEIFLHFVLNGQKKKSSKMKVEAMFSRKFFLYNVRMQERSIFKGQGYNKVNRCAVINILRKNKALFFLHNLSLQRRQTHPLPTHSVEITGILSNAFLSKISWKQRRILKSWFDEIFFGEREFLVYPHCATKYLARPDRFISLRIV